MSITTSIKILSRANAGIPALYVPATLPTLTNKITQLYVVDLPVATIENAVPATALTNLETDLQAYLTADFYDDILHLDAADTIASNITVTNIERLRQEENDFEPGLEFYRISFTCEYSY